VAVERVVGMVDLLRDLTAKGRTLGPLDEPVAVAPREFGNLDVARVQPAAAVSSMERAIRLPSLSKRSEASPPGRFLA
jgi:hypothetical protein